MKYRSFFSLIHPSSILKVLWEQGASYGIHPWRVVVYTCMVGTGALLSLLALIGPVADESDFFSYYINLAVGPLFQTFLSFFLVVFCCLFIYGAFLFFSSAFSSLDPTRFFSKEFLLKIVHVGVREFSSMLSIMVPVIFTFLFVSVSMSYINPVNATRLIDIRVASWDYALFGFHPFIVFQSISYPNWFVWLVDFSFMNLPVFLILSSVYVFFRDRRVFEEIAAVFCLSLILMIFFWQIFPVLSPHDRFIDNVYHLDVPQDIAEGLAREYRPQPMIQSFLESIRDRKNESLGGVMPTSTLPSAHVAWATLLVYYAFRVKKKSLIILFPIALFSTIGTVLFAQHYFVDVPGGILVMGLSIWIIRVLGRTSGGGSLVSK